MVEHLPSSLLFPGRQLCRTLLARVGDDPRRLFRSSPRYLSRAPFRPVRPPSSVLLLLGALPVGLAKRLFPSGAAESA